MKKALKEGTIFKIDSTIIKLEGFWTNFYSTINKAFKL